MSVECLVRQHLKVEALYAELRAEKKILDDYVHGHSQCYPSGDKAVVKIDGRCYLATFPSHLDDGGNYTVEEVRMDGGR